MRWASEEERRTTQRTRGSAGVASSILGAGCTNGRGGPVRSVGGKTIRVQRAARPGVACAIQYCKLCVVCAIMRHGLSGASMWTDVGPGVAATRQRRRHCSRMPRCRSRICGASLATVGHSPKARIVHKRGASLHPATTRRSTGILSSVHPLCIPVRPQVSAKRAQRTGGAGSDRRTLVTCQPASPHEPMYHVHENSTHELPAISDAHLQAPTCCGGNVPAIPFPSIPGVSDGPGVRVHRPDNCQTGANSGLECQ